MLLIFAARGGTKSQGYIYSGSNNIDGVAWCSTNSGNTHPVATKGANELGLYDMSGNVWEWCWDWMGGYSGTGQTDPKGPTFGTLRFLRGSSFCSTTRTTVGSIIATSSTRLTATAITAFDVSRTNPIALLHFYSLRNTIDGLILACLTAGTFGWLWPH
jgi:hypothetical protein